MDVGQDSPKAADFSVQVPLGLSGDGPWYRLQLPLTLQLSTRRSDEPLREVQIAVLLLGVAVLAGMARSLLKKSSQAVLQLPLPVNLAQGNRSQWRIPCRRLACVWRTSVNCASFSSLPTGAFHVPRYSKSLFD